jgi:hypothetical protein
MLGWRKFAYTKRKFRFYSPLNGFIPGFSDPVMSIDLENTDNKEKKSAITGISRLQVLSFSEDDQNEAMFKLPNEKEIRDNVPFLEMYHLKQE